MAEQAAKDSGVTERPLSRRERKKAEIRQRLYETAMELFGRQGFAETTIEQITEPADVSPATFFNYFPSKEAVLTDYHRATVVGILKHAEQLDHASVRDRLLALCDYQEEQAEREGRLFRVLVRRFLGQPEMLRVNIEVSMQLFQLLVRWFEEGQSGGEIRADVEVMHVVTTYLAIVNATLLEWAAGEPRLPCVVSLRDRVALLFDGLRPRDEQ